MGKVERGHFVGHWTLPGGYMDHDEHPETGCVRETFEEMGIEISLLDEKPVITQNIFTSEGISFLSFTYRANWSDFCWFSPKDALSNAISGFDIAALKHL